MTQVVYLSNEKDSSETANKIQTDSIRGIRTGGSNVRPGMAWQKLVFTFKYILQVLQPLLHIKTPHLYS